mmetsp:Transcript_36822/g.92286  ORF Transcript_36822/g.92286 Transcript_36822/m.92286 type:complete len:146 (+) Transcript_36822:1400-1837(+)
MCVSKDVALYGYKQSKAHTHTRVSECTVCLQQGSGKKDEAQHHNTHNSTAQHACLCVRVHGPRSSIMENAQGHPSIWTSHESRRMLEVRVPRKAVYGRRTGPGRPAKKGDTPPPTDTTRTYGARVNTDSMRTTHRQTIRQTERRW